MKTTLCSLFFLMIHLTGNSFELDILDYIKYQQHTYDYQIKVFYLKYIDCEFKEISDRDLYFYTLGKKELCEELINKLKYKTEY